MRFAAVLLAGAAMVLTACAADVTTLSGTPVATRRVPAPSIRSGEYRRSWGLEVVDAHPAYAAGLTGKGVTVALIDVGLEGAQAEVKANMSPLSTDLSAGRDPQYKPSRHGGYVAGTLASTMNGGGVIGVAYEATVLSIRADIDGHCYLDDCELATRDLAKGIDYALDNGVRLIALAVQGPNRLTATFEAALTRAKAAGAVVVVAAGNDSETDPSWPARYAADPRFKGTVIAVGAVDYRSEILSWSNRAGEAAGSYLVAPGHRIVTDCDERFCTLVSGTSFAVPYVAGAIALVMQAQPRLSAEQAGDLVLRSARDLGKRGDDPVFGRGLVDIAAAVRLARRPAVATAAPKAPGA